MELLGKSLEDLFQSMDKKFTIFGKVTGPTFFNAVNISNLTANEDGCPAGIEDRLLPV